MGLVQAWVQMLVEEWEVWEQVRSGVGSWVGLYANPEVGIGAGLGTGFCAGPSVRP